MLWIGKNEEIILSGKESIYASNSTRISLIDMYKQKVEFKEGDNNNIPLEIQIPKEVKEDIEQYIYLKYY